MYERLSKVNESVLRRPQSWQTVKRSRSCRNEQLAQLPWRHCYQTIYVTSLERRTGSRSRVTAVSDVLCSFAQPQIPPLAGESSFRHWRRPQDIGMIYRVSDS
jgi:hypothetical protein